MAENARMSLGHTRITRRDLDRDVSEPLLERIRDGQTIDALIDAAVPELFLDAEQLVRALLRLERHGRLALELITADARLAAALERIDAPGTLLDEDPALHNLVGLERDLSRHPERYDHPRGTDALAELKCFERDLYLDLLDPHLSDIGAGAHVLDAGCGVGRLAVELHRRGFRLTLVDASPTSLKRAVAHLLDSGAHLAALEVHLADLRRLSALPDGHAEATLALEVLCYLPDPEAALAELKRVTRPGGLIALSVEGHPGSLLADDTISLDLARDVLLDGRLLRPEDLYVEYYTAERLRDLIAAAGLESPELHGCHYVPEGPLDRLLPWERLGEPAVREQALALEAACRADPRMRPLARAWLAIARKRAD